MKNTDLLPLSRQLPLYSAGNRNTAKVLAIVNSPLPLFVLPAAIFPLTVWQVVMSYHFSLSLMEDWLAQYGDRLDPGWPDGYLRSQAGWLALFRIYRVRLRV